MKTQRITALLVLALLGIWGSSVWVPPYSRGAEQFAQSSRKAAASITVSAPTQGTNEGQTWVYGLLTDARGNPLPNARIRATLAKPKPTNLSAQMLTMTDSVGRYAVELPHAKWDWWFEGGINRRDSGSTALGTQSFDTVGYERLDLQLPGHAQLLGELQVSEQPGLLLDCELMNSDGELLARGDAVSGETLLGQVFSNVRSRFATSVTAGPAASSGLCLEGLPAGDYTLRAYLDRERGAAFDLSVQLPKDKTLDLGRVQLDLADFDPRLEGARPLHAD